MQAEVFVLWLDGDVPALTGPCGPQAWYLEVGADEDPLDVVAAAVRRVLGEPVVVHSTSWRRSRGAVVLGFITVILAEQLGSMAPVPVGRSDLARNTATAAPESVATGQLGRPGPVQARSAGSDQPSEPVVTSTPPIRAVARTCRVGASSGRSSGSVTRTSTPPATACSSTSISHVAGTMI